MDSPKLSIIVPVYNVDKYINKCIESILAQTFTDFELLLVNDGSLDSSGSICDEYEKKDSRIKVFHKENGGVSSARNLGLENARGEWIAFVDGDDWISPEMYKKLLVYSENDIILCGYIEKDDNKENCKPILFPTGPVIDSKLFLSKIIGPLEFGLPIQMGAIWMGIFKKQLIGKNRFLNIRMCEDKLFLINIILLNPNIYISSESLYFYRVNRESTTKKYSCSLIDDLTKAQAYTKEILENYEVYTLYKREYNNTSLFFLEMICYNEAWNHKISLLSSSRKINNFVSFANIASILGQINLNKITQNKLFWALIRMKSPYLGLIFLRIKIFLHKHLIL
ncbi:MAG: glycosyltransferase [Clostridia bacterium]